MAYDDQYQFRPARRPESSGSKRSVLVVVMIAIAALTIAAWVLLYDRGPDEPTAAAASTSVPVVVSATSSTSPPSTMAATEAAAEPPPVVDTGGSVLVLDASAVGEAVLDSVVTVQVSGGGAGSGSGVVYGADGHVITNNHVVEVGSAYQIVLTDGRVYPASLVGTDPVTDLAVLRIEAGGLKPVEIGSSDAMSVGDPTIAAGSPLGLEGGPSLTVGVLSAFGRVVQTDATTVLYGMLQTDAPITQGSSGGALVDARGRLLGITTAVGVSSVGIEGVGFATPVEIVTRVVDELVAEGSASETFMGITGSTAFAATGDGGERPIGVEVAAVEPGSPASLAGIAPGDVVTAVGEFAIDTMPELVALLRRFAAGDSVSMTIESAGSSSVTTVVLASR